MASVEETYQLLKKHSARRDLRNALDGLRETNPEDFKVFLDFLCRECHITKPRFFAEETKMREAEGRRKLGMGILELLAADDPQEIINRLEMEAQHAR